MTPENAAFFLGVVAGSAGVSLIWAFAWLRATRRRQPPSEFYGDQTF